MASLTISEVCDKLWELDKNRLVPNQDYKINLQAETKVYHRRDSANDKLFTWVKEDVFARKTYKLFVDLLDNYERSTGSAETVTAKEKKENWDFLEECLQTPVMKFCHQYLVSKNLAEQDHEAFKKQLHQLWFALFRRDGVLDSSGFEHVFVGELRDNKIIGFHNWIQFYLEEKRGNVDYKGYIVTSKRGKHAEKFDGDEQLITIKFSWSGEDKDLSSIFIGTSPEFELALYTLCFLHGDEDNIVQVGPYDVNIKCFRIKSVHGDKIQASFPIALDITKDEVATHFNANPKPILSAPSSASNGNVTANHVEKKPLDEEHKQPEANHQQESNHSEPTEKQKVKKQVKLPDNVPEWENKPQVVVEAKSPVKEEEKGEPAKPISFLPDPSEQHVPGTPTPKEVPPARWGPKPEESLVEKLAREEELRKHQEEKKQRELEEKRRIQQEIKRKADLENFEQQRRDEEVRRKELEEERKKREKRERLEREEQERKKEEKRRRAEEERERRRIQEEEERKQQAELERKQKKKEEAEKKRAAETAAKSPPPKSPPQKQPAKPPPTTPTRGRTLTVDAKKKKSAPTKSPVIKGPAPLSDEHMGAAWILMVVGLIVVAAAIFFETR